MKQLGAIKFRREVEIRSTLAAARMCVQGWRENGQARWIVLGDVTDEGAQYWVCAPADADKLIKTGYELAKFEE